jgi:phage gp29-like protein
MAAPLKDKSGRKVDPKKLVQERARPAGTGPRPWKYSSLASGLTPSKLAGILKKADEGDCTELLTLAAEIERRDSHVGAQLRTRRLALAGLPWVVEAPSDSPADKAIADQLQQLVRRHTFSTLVFDLLDAIFKPWACVEILWSFGEKWTPSKFIWRDPRSFAVSLEDGQTLLLKTTEAPKGEELDPWKYIVHAPRMFSGPLTTSGLVRPCAVMYSLKTLGLSAWLGYMEIFGIPWRIGRFPKGASEEDKDSLAEAVQVLGMEGGVVLPEGMTLEIQNAMGSGAGSQLHQQLADWCDRQTSKAILGQTLTADTGGGSYAQGSVHDGIRRTLLQADAVDLAATLQRDLIEPWIAINYGDQVEPPTLRCQVEEPEDKKAFVDCLIPLVDRGLRVESSVIRDRMGIPAPVEGDAVEVLTPASQAKTPVGEV